MHIVLTGGTGFIGSALADALRARGDEVSMLARDPDRARRRFGKQFLYFPRWNEAPTQADAVINLAGEPLVGKRWTAAYRDQIRASRLSVTQGMNAWLQRIPMPPEVVISGSAIGYYGSDSERVFTEADPAGEDFGARLCADWEALAQEARRVSTVRRVITLRTGVVLEKNGGALARMLLPFRLGLGGRVGSGRQWFSWIHRADLINAILFLMDTPGCDGAYNLTAPGAVPQQDFARQLAHALGKPAFMPMPGFALKLLFGEGANLLLEGQNVQPKRLLDAGFRFQYPQLPDALNAILSSK